jgi:hypothetical protein
LLEKIRAKDKNTEPKGPKRNVSMEPERITVLFATLTSAAYTAR